MELSGVVKWMLLEIKKHGCLYQDDVVDYLVKSNAEIFLKENADGNLVIGTKVLSAFLKETQENVVWVKQDRYWRFRVKEDEEGREARG